MKSWSTPADLKGQLVRLWQRGTLLEDAVTGNERFPMRLGIRGPTSRDITEHFEAVRRWAADLGQETRLRLAWRTIRHRVQGMQAVPEAAWIDSRAQALNWLGKHTDWQRFSALVAQTREGHPQLLPWLKKRPLQALALAEVWPLLLAVVDWIHRHPDPGIHLRQLDIPGVHSKFIENHRGVLTELLDQTLPPAQIHAEHAGSSRFAARYGFLEKATRIRFRILDPSLTLIAGTHLPDITLDVDNFSRLDLDIQRVLITENETNFLALPPLPRTIALFGAGYGWSALARACWLSDQELHYWGDIDTHGFAILDRLRAHFPHVRSLLMDRKTLEAHRAFWGREDRPHQGELQHLTPMEAELYDDLRHDRIREHLRLEQEHLGFNWVKAELGLPGDTSPGALQG